MDTVKAKVLLYFEKPWESQNLATIQVSSWGHVLLAEAAIAHIDEVLDHYLHIPLFDCCHFRVGMSIEVNGTSWNDYYEDHLWHLGGWFVATARILRGSGAGVERHGEEITTATFVWDESYLVLRRNSAALTIYDRHPSTGRYTWPPVTVHLGTFARELLREGKVCIELMETLLDAIERRGFSRFQLLSDFQKQLGAAIDPLTIYTQLYGGERKSLPADLRMAILMYEYYKAGYLESVYDLEDALATASRDVL